MPVTVNTEARPHEVDEIQFGADGDLYEFVTPKSGILLSGLIKEQQGEDSSFTDSKMTYLRDGMKPGDWDQIVARLGDPKDALDTQHLIDMVDALLSRGANRPSSSSGGSSKGPSKKASGGKRKPQAETSGDSLPEGSAT